MLKRVCYKILAVFSAMYSFAFFCAGIAILIKEDVKQGKLLGFIIAMVGGILLGLAAKKLFRMSRKVREQTIVSPPVVKNIKSNQAPSPSLNPSPVITSTIQRQEVPQQVLHDIRMSYTGQQALNDMRIIDESLAIMEKTSDIDTFLSRYETAMRCALTLEQAKKAGIPITLSDNFSHSLVNAKGKALEGVIYRSFQKELDSINKLKTDKGKMNRVEKYQEKLNDIYAEFEFVAEYAYNDVMRKLELLKKELN